MSSHQKDHHYRHKHLSANYYKHFKENEPQNNSFLSIDLPLHTYETTDFVVIPFNIVESNDHKFMTIDAAMKFVANHCLKNHGCFRLSLARVYLDHCLIYNIFSQKYEQIFDLEESSLKSIYHKALNEVCRRNCNDGVK